MKIVFLDVKTIGEDIDLSYFDELGEVVKYPARVLIHLNDANMQCYLRQHANNGDKVIVQIRKKED